MLQSDVVMSLKVGNNIRGFIGINDLEGALFGRLELEALDFTRSFLALLVRDLERHLEARQKSGAPDQ